MIQLAIAVASFADVKTTLPPPTVFPLYVTEPVTMARSDLPTGLCSQPPDRSMLTSEPIAKTVHARRVVHAKSLFFGKFISNLPVIARYGGIVRTNNAIPCASAEVHIHSP